MRVADQNNALLCALYQTAALTSGFRPTLHHLLFAPCPRRHRSRTASLFCRPVQALAALIASPDLYSPPFVRRAQIMRAILLARAVATTLKGRRARMAPSHEEASVLCRACLKTEVAPRINKERNVVLPIFVQDALCHRLNAVLASSPTRQQNDVRT